MQKAYIRLKYWYICK